MIKLKLVKGLSYTGYGVRATAASPFVEVDKEKTANALIGTGYFSLVAEQVNGSAQKHNDEKPLEKMSDKELDAYAAENGVDLSGINKKADKLTAIQHALAENELFNDEQ